MSSQIASQKEAVAQAVAHAQSLAQAEVKAEANDINNGYRCHSHNGQDRNNTSFAAFSNSVKDNLRHEINAVNHQNGFFANGGHNVGVPAPHFQGILHARNAYVNGGNNTSNFNFPPFVPPPNPTVIGQAFVAPSNSNGLPVAREQQQDHHQQRDQRKRTNTLTSRRPLPILHQQRQRSIHNQRPNDRTQGTSNGQAVQQISYNLYYAVRHGNNNVRNAIFLRWEDCQQHVEVHPNAPTSISYSAFYTLEAAIQYLLQLDDHPPPKQEYDDNTDDHHSMKEVIDSDEDDDDDGGDKSCSSNSSSECSSNEDGYEEYETDNSDANGRRKGKHKRRNVSPSFPRLVYPSSLKRMKELNVNAIDHEAHNKHTSDKTEAATNKNNNSKGDIPSDMEGNKKKHYTRHESEVFEFQHVTRSTWPELIRFLKALKKEYGHANILPNDVNKPLRNLGRKLRRMKVDKETNELGHVMTDKMIRQLERLGFVFNADSIENGERCSYSFEERLDQMKVFVSKYNGDFSKLPARSILGHYFSRLKSAYAALLKGEPTSILDHAKAVELQKLGVPLAPNTRKPSCTSSNLVKMKFERQKQLLDEQQNEMSKKRRRKSDETCPNKNTQS